ncbi:MBL fold metallo-hydrolase [Sulfurimonas marina]|uniref:MBL fold metallo-hydrolase n=1 Tax=Sulfurimonas marina TaxID=2590551 RepID=A0A7M1AUP1_9BACT|nr:MBL fold metallo-hydrolase [Sulfurimonas marina]QOP41161.1 MBL fold metallo-hydrolase [Sulfurimonas marina]
MENETILYDDGVHKCIMFSFDDEEQEESYLAVNQFLIIQNNSGILIDPGSQSAFNEMYDAVERHLGVDKLKYIFYSHQDPDVAGSIAEWSVASTAKIIISGLWSRFMSHYGLMDLERIMPLPDPGAKISFGDNYLQFVPAHFLHSPGNFTLYDSRSKILFSGDIGAAVMPVHDIYKEVHNFDKHLTLLEAFHKRYMAGNHFTKKWVHNVRKYDVDMIAPQHGAIFKGEDVEKFLTWFEGLQCGGDIM